MAGLWERSQHPPMVAIERGSHKGAVRGVLLGPVQSYAVWNPGRMRSGTPDGALGEGAVPQPWSARFMIFPMSLRGSASR